MWFIPWASLNIAAAACFRPLNSKEKRDINCISYHGQDIHLLDYSNQIACMSFFQEKKTLSLSTKKRLCRGLCTIYFPSKRPCHPLNQLSYCQLQVWLMRSKIEGKVSRRKKFCTQLMALEGAGGVGHRYSEWGFQKEKNTKYTCLFTSKMYHRTDQTCHFQELADPDQWIWYSCVFRHFCGHLICHSDIPKFLSLCLRLLLILSFSHV